MWPHFKAVPRSPPRSESNVATSSCSNLIAQSNGKEPFLAIALTRAPFSMSNLATLMCPCRAAQCKGVLPYLSRPSTSAPSLIRKSTISDAFPRAAACNTVFPVAVSPLMSAPAFKWTLTARRSPSIVAASNSAVDDALDVFVEAIIDHDNRKKLRLHGPSYPVRRRTVSPKPISAPARFACESAGRSLRWPLLKRN